MVGAAMAEGQLVRLVAGGEAKQLVAEADAEHRHAAEQAAHDLGLERQRLRIARPVRQQHAVVAGELLRSVAQTVSRAAASAAARRRTMERLAP